uniref:C2H2-type domain-containing protein n=1 Tax=Glossina austeni TaxID=7395 RepID=A0A1A9UY86_GLOAU
MDYNFLRTYRNRSYVQREFANSYETLLPPPALGAVHHDYGSYAYYDDSPISPMINCAGQASAAEVCCKNRFIPVFAKPSGAGYYDPKGRWVCTASKQSFKIANDKRYDIGVQIKVSKSSSTDTNASKDVPKPNTETNDQSNNLLFCSLCCVSVTSALQMAMHLSGIKHKKKAQKTGAESTKLANEANTYQSVTTCFQLQEIALSTVLQVGLSTADSSDVFVCRTPNGQFYCNVCNTTMINVRSLQQHLSGKRHLKAQIPLRLSIFQTRLEGRHVAKCV